MPLAKGRKALAQCAHGVLSGVVGQVAGYRLGSGRQKAAPLGLEMVDGSLVAAPRVVAGGGADVALDVGHGAVAGIQW
ncbi:hypothetical protein D3C79_935400 [compost metagenome]